ncbi:acetamidase/formamidase family protein [Deinococcus aquiradiocola]|uniref:Acetamidase n=1 Tax=Deinococcus aquiradiocola TaxID=393059 RepID=A0A917UP53_9DEIO|nr:acetamidase/formamidase family protein [Deinococcus aquiradiocola]GGJ72322.1 acetamidase [Deinococcus aquiradiocola]
MTGTHHLGTQSVHTVWDAALTPALTVRSGDTVTLDTLDASYGSVARRVQAGELALPAHLAPDLRDAVLAAAYPVRPSTGGLRGHPLTGPVHVQGAEPGDTLAIDILDVRPAAWGWTGCRPDGIGLLDRALAPHLPAGGYTHVWDLRARTYTDFRPGIRVPLAPFPGVIGVAPAAPGPHVTSPPRQVGGNMDIRQLVSGSTLYLPVEVPGALLSAGDLHAAQGDGELSGTGIEMDGQLTLRVTVMRDHPVRTPEFRAPPEPTGLWSAGSYAATGHAPDLMDAARTALQGLLAYMTRTHALSVPDAYILASACVDLRISQIVDAPNYTVSALLPLSIFG